MGRLVATVDIPRRLRVPAAPAAICWGFLPRSLANKLKVDAHGLVDMTLAQGVRRAHVTPPACTATGTEVPRSMGNGEEQGEKQTARGFQGAQLLAEASGLSQTKQAERAKAGQFLYSKKTSPSSSIKKAIISAFQMAYSGLCIYDKRYTHHLL